ncbi:MAG TPA: HAD family phosphatase [Reyranella sp.]|nr:HAD family phosphatase [Reyranella sp.]
MTQPFAAVICDFDGVIADSEVGANQALADSLCAIGLPTTFDDCLRDYCGHNWLETERLAEARLGCKLPVGFLEQYLERARHRFESEFASVPGAGDFLGACPLPLAIASSSGLAYLKWALERLELAACFGKHLYSAEGMERGKPHPDIYLTAARGLGVAPDRCLAIEDSPVGAQAAVAAGMTVVGLVAAGHILEPANHAERLRAAGVHHIAFAFDEVAALAC